MSYAAIGKTQRRLMRTTDEYDAAVLIFRVSDSHSSKAA